MTIQTDQGQLTGCSCSWCRLRVAQATKSAAVVDHSSLLYAGAVHSSRPCSWQYLRKTSSHFIHRRRDGRLGRFESISSARRCQSESRQVVTRQVQASFDLRATCPAHDHFARKCASTHSRVSYFWAIFNAFFVVRLIQLTQSSLGAFRCPTIFRSIITPLGRS